MRDYYWFGFLSFNANLFINCLKQQNKKSSFNRFLPSHRIVQ